MRAPSGLDLRFPRNLFSSAGLGHLNHFFPKKVGTDKGDGGKVGYHSKEMTVRLHQGPQ